MQWILLIGDENFNLETIKKVKHFGSLNSYTISELNGRYCVNFEKSHIFYDFTDINNEFEEDIKSVPFKEPKIITAVYTEKECIRKVISQEDFPKNIYIDNDFGLIIPIVDFIRIGMPLDEDDMKAIYNK